MHNLSYLLFFCHSFIQTRKMRIKSTLFNPWIRNMDTERNKLIMDVCWQYISWFLYFRFWQQQGCIGGCEGERWWNCILEFYFQIKTVDKPTRTNGVKPSFHPPPDPEQSSQEYNNYIVQHCQNITRLRVKKIIVNKSLQKMSHTDSGQDFPHGSWIEKESVQVS